MLLRSCSVDLQSSPGSSGTECRGLTAARTATGFGLGPQAHLSWPSCQRKLPKSRPSPAPIRNLPHPQDTAQKRMIGTASDLQIACLLNCLRHPFPATAHRVAL